MPLKIHHPKANAKHPQNLLIVQGTCDNSAKIDGVLIDKATGQAIPGGQKLTTKPKQWGYLYRNLGDGNYQFTITQTNSPVSTDQVAFAVKKVPPPAPNLSPTVTAPATGDEVAVVFYPYGTSTKTITGIVFSGNGNSTNGTVTQQPDSGGNWAGEVDGIDTWPNGPDNLYQLAVSNASGTTTVNNLDDLVLVNWPTH